MTGPDTTRQGQIAGGLIIAATLGSLVFMLHHPTSVAGPDDGMLMRDWGIGPVHAGMLICLVALLLALSVMARRLNEDHASVRMGMTAFTLGMQALIGAGLINGFVLVDLANAIPDQATLVLPFRTLWAVNQALTGLGIGLGGLATSLWSIRMLASGGMNRVTGGLGLALGALAAWWLLAGQGEFGLYPAVTATVAFGVWSLMVAVQMIRGRL